MGRLVTYLSILIMMDLLFVMTGQLCNSASSCTVSSILFSMALNPSAGVLSTWFSSLIGNVSALATGAAVVGMLGFLLSRLTAGGVSAQAIFQGLTNDTILFAAAGFTLAGLVGDFIAIFQYLSSYSLIAALLTMSTMITMYILTVLEWVRGIP